MADSFVKLSAIICATDAGREGKDGKTSPPKPFTDDTLLSSMGNANKAETDAERKGIGTPATRAGILEKLIKSGLAERKGDKKAKYFTATHKGTALITVLPEQVQSPLMTAEWEEKLKLVERGELTADTFLSEIVGMTTALVKTYDCVAVLDDTGGQFVNFTMEFSAKKK